MEITCHGSLLIQLNISAREIPFIFQAYCKMLGAGLAEINSDAEEKLVEGFLQTLHGTVNLEIFARVLFSRTFAYAKFREIKAS